MHKLLFGGQFNYPPNDITGGYIYLRWVDISKILWYTAMPILIISFKISYRHFRYRFFSIYWYDISDKCNMVNFL